MTLMLVISYTCLTIYNILLLAWYTCASAFANSVFVTLPTAAVIINTITQQYIIYYTLYN